MNMFQCFIDVSLIPQIFWAFFHAGAWPYALPYAGLDPTVAAMAASAAGGLISPWKYGREWPQKHMVLTCHVGIRLNEKLSYKRQKGHIIEK